MKILVANNHLEMTGGSENFTYTLIRELVSRGYNVEYYCAKRGDAANRIEADFGVKFRASRSYDLILVNHNTMVEANISRGFIIQTCHGIFPHLEQPSKYADRYVGVSQEICSYLSSMGFKSNLILNGIDCKLFTSDVAVHPQAKCILSLCQGEEATQIVNDACDELGIEFISASKTTNNIFAVEELINRADMVVGIGRSLYDAMACGRACISYDSRAYSTKFDGHSCGGDGYINLDNIEQCLIHNCTGRGSGRHFDREGIIEQIKLYKADDAAQLRDFALQRLNIVHSVDKYLEMYAEHLNTDKNPRLTILRKIIAYTFGRNQRNKGFFSRLWKSIKSR